MATKRMAAIRYSVVAPYPFGALCCTFSELYVMAAWRRRHLAPHQAWLTR